MPLRLAIGLLSAAALAYQLLLMRLFSIAQWHHLAFMVISLALLGYGASGAFLTVARRLLLERFETAFVAFAALFGLLAPACFALSQRFRLSPLELVWAPGQLGVVAAVYLILALPFFCAGSAIGLALARFEDSIHRIYRADLAGAAAGASAAIAVLYFMPASAALRLAGAAGGLAAGIVWVSGWASRRDPPPASGRGALVHLARPALAAAALLASAVWPAGWLEPRVSEYKALAKALQVPGVEIVARRSSPLGELAAVRSSQIPFRMAPGLSFAYSGEIPEQIVVFRDGELEAVVDRGDGRGARAAAYLRFLPPALAFELMGGAAGSVRVAVLGAGSGPGLDLALAYGAAEIEAAEADPRLLELLGVELAEFAGRPFERPGVRARALAPRAFLADTGEPFDLVLLPPVAGGAEQAAALRERYAHTVEAFGAGLARLTDEGILAVEGEIDAPLRTSLKLAATAIEALERAGREPGRHLAVIRSWNRFVLLVGKSPFEVRQIEMIRRFSAERSFDVAWYPGMPESEANRYNLLEGPELFRGIEALLGPDRDRFLRGYRFDVSPATDDRPHLHHVFRWSSAPELLRLRATGGAALLDWSYVFLIVTLVQAALAGLVLILMPLWYLRRRAPAAGAGRVGLYFLCLGLAFLLLEIAFIQRLTLFLARPILAAAVVLAGFLLFAGLGSGLSERYARLAARRAIPSIAIAITVVALLELLLLPPLFELASAWPLGLRLATALLAIAPLAFLLGMPFPLGLRRVAARRHEFVPWAWGVNGWASVLAAVLATVLAVDLGFTAVVLAACGLYLVAAVTAPESSPARPEP